MYYKHGKPPRSYVWPGRELFRLGNPLIISVPPTWMGLSSSSTLDSNWTLSLMRMIGKGFTLNRRNVSQVIYFQIHITEKYNIVICSRNLGFLYEYEVLVFSRIKKDKACSKLGYTSISEMLSVTWKCIYVNSLHWYLSIGQNSFHPLYQYEALTQYIGHRSLFVAERYCPHRQQTKYPKAPMLKHFKVKDIFIFLLDCCGFSWL